jgi:hypothetical protein
MVDQVDGARFDMKVRISEIRNANLCEATTDCKFNSIHFNIQGVPRKTGPSLVKYKSTYLRKAISNISCKFP